MAAKIAFALGSAFSTLTIKAALNEHSPLHPDGAPRVVQESVAGDASLKPFVLGSRYRRSISRCGWSAGGLSAVLAEGLDTTDQRRNDKRPAAGSEDGGRRPANRWRCARPQRSITVIRSANEFLRGAIYPKIAGDAASMLSQK
jgi:hypothetical protein